MKYVVHAVSWNKPINIIYKQINHQSIYWSVKSHLCPPLCKQVFLLYKLNMKSGFWCCQWSQYTLHDKHLGRCLALLPGYSMAHGSCHLNHHRNTTFSNLFILFQSVIFYDSHLLYCLWVHFKSTFDFKLFTTLKEIFAILTQKN